LDAENLLTTVPTETCRAGGECPAVGRARPANIDASLAVFPAEEPEWSAVPTPKAENALDLFPTEASEEYALDTTDWRFLIADDPAPSPQLSDAMGGDTDDEFDDIELYILDPADLRKLWDRARVAVMVALATFMLPARIAEDHVSRRVVAPVQAPGAENVKSVRLDEQRTVVINDNRTEAPVVAPADPRPMFPARVATTGPRSSSLSEREEAESRSEGAGLGSSAPEPPTPMRTPTVTPPLVPRVDTPVAVHETRPHLETPPASPTAPAPIVAPVEPLVVKEDAAAVRAVLDRYQAAFSDLDARKAKAIWPSVDERALGRAFGQLQQQQIVLESCGVEVTGERAAAACGGRASYVPRVGNKAARVEARSWAFTLRKTGDSWIIEAIELSTGPSRLSPTASASPRPR
jgi:hypothetical protein